MRIKSSPLFSRQYKRLEKKHFPVKLIQPAVTAIVIQDKLALRRLHDHALHNNWAGFRELHPAGKLDNWIMIYNIIEDDGLVLTLVQTGDHKNVLGI
ncbi:type II toxin-antitoxin system mRNA interferase toxin, RelE/StbE family [Levilactobacillus wangkuiensis]|nr:type II toxin-antitoxin system mRNA interferase toxin, RelE/StbE family [Levilactobacillus wangkuiensis]